MSLWADNLEAAAVAGLFGIPVIESKALGYFGTVMVPGDLMLGWGPRIIVGDTYRFSADMYVAAVAADVRFNVRVANQQWVKDLEARGLRPVSPPA